MNIERPSIQNFDLKTLITILLPGFIVLVPYLPIIKNEFLKNNISDTLIVTLILLASLFFGIIIDDLAVILENFIFDKRNIKKSEKEGVDFKEYWEKFLLLTYDKEPVGHRYLRNVLTRMKFQSCTLLALILTLPGIFLLKHANNINCKQFVILLLIVCILITFLYFMARGTSEALGSLRKILVDKFSR